jgi:dTDP-4-amino-4,6-dideoxygalactose transaminase
MTRIWLSSPDVGPLEREALLAAFDSGWIAPAGPDITGFESDMCEFVGWPGAVAVSSGTSALHLALLNAGIERGDVVLASTFTFVATVNAITYCGAEPVLIDASKDTWNLSPELLRAAVERSLKSGKHPKAVVMVDLYGQCADADAIRSICHEYEIVLIEDAAEALGSAYKGRPAGTLGDIGVFSFNGNKIITTSGGGMVVTPNLEIAQQLRYFATQARQPVVHYEHTDIGYNYRMSNLLAAIGRVQLQRLPLMIERRRMINERYRNGLSSHEEVEFMPIPEWSGWNGWLTCVLFENGDIRDGVMTVLADTEIESRPLWKPMHLQPVYGNAEAVVDGTSEELFDRGLCLPSSSVLSDNDVDEVIAHIRSALM